VLVVPELYTKWNLNMLMLVVVEKTTYQAQSYSQTKTETSHLLSPNRDLPCVTI